jgi:hypothetical protein
VRPNQGTRIDFFQIFSIFLGSFRQRLHFGSCMSPDICNQHLLMARTGFRTLGVFDLSTHSIFLLFQNRPGYSGQLVRAFIISQDSVNCWSE